MMNREESQLAETTDDAEARKDLWSKKGDFLYRHHIEPRVQIYVTKEETFSISLKYIDAARSTHTDLDVARRSVPFRAKKIIFLKDSNFWCVQSSITHTMWPSMCM